MGKTYQKRIFILVAALLLFANESLAGTAVDSFPVPKPSPKQLFYLQRTTNSNTIICDVNLDAKGQVIKDNPVHVYWIRYDEGGEKKELSYIQETFAYGIKHELLPTGVYKLHFVSYKKQVFYLKRSPKDNQYKMYFVLNNKEFVLQKLFVRIDGGTFWVPNVVYMEIIGKDEYSGTPFSYKFKP
ncbi:MAG: hypothetical protein RL372_874 [Bacteroidota bacterium]|jgi:hypothetical protein